ncbi:MAG: C40 family peptidase [Gudongella sp.]|nr:C40 family peptidase [Gudongella sp.]
MNNKKYELWIKISLLSMLMIIGFKDTGVFVRQYSLMDNNSQQVLFEQEEIVSVFRETNDSFEVVKNYTYYKIPKDTMIRTNKDSDRFVVKTNTPLYSERDVNSNVVREITTEDELVFVSQDEEFGYYITATDFKIGYIELTNIVAKEQAVVTLGLSNVTRNLTNNDKVLSLAKDDKVAIVGFANGQYQIQDANKVIYNIEETAITLFKTQEMANRGAERTDVSDVKKLIDAARSKIGSPYVYATAGPNTFDCSGFTSWLYKSQLGISITRSSRDQPSAGEKVERANLQAGDLVFFNTMGNGISHVGMYIGNGEMIHASSYKRGVRIDSINSSYYSPRYVTATRILN